MGKPVGSSAWYQSDTAETEYGDIDLQMIAPEIEGLSQNQIIRKYNAHADQFVRETKPPYVYDEGRDTGGHIIFGTDNEYVQVDFVWTLEPYREWAQYRSTPERGLKGVVYGSLYSTLGEMLNTSIQSVGVQAKMIGGEPQPFSRTRKYDELRTVSKDIRNFGVDIFDWVAGMAGVQNPRTDPELAQHPGLNPQNIQAVDLIHMIRGLAKSFERNDLYGRGVLKDYENSSDFLNEFIRLFDEKMEKAATATKFQKAESPEAKAKAEKAKQSIRRGKDLIRKYLT
jgi:hypothetical protein